MKLYDIKSRERRAISVQLEEEVSGMESQEVTRIVRRVDRETGKDRPRPETKKFPPVLRWGAREVLKDLPEAVMKSAALQAHIKAGRLIVVATKEDAAKPAPAAKAPAARTARKRKRR